MVVLEGLFGWNHFGCEMEPLVWVDLKFGNMVKVISGTLATLALILGGLLAYGFLWMVQNDQETLLAVLEWALVMVTSILGGIVLCAVWLWIYKSLREK